MKCNFLLVCFTVYLLGFTFSNNQAANAYFSTFQNDFMKFFKVLDSFKDSFEQFKSTIGNRFGACFKSNKTLKSHQFLTHKVANKFVQNGCKCLNFTCSCCATIELKKYNLSNTGFVFN